MSGAVNKLYPAGNFKQVTPSDSTDFVHPVDGGTLVCRGISVAVAGDVALKDEAGTSQTLKNLAAGVVHPLKTKRILATGTTATGICIYW